MPEKDWHGVFDIPHELPPGPPDLSYGIHVAKLAGLPKRVTDRAAEVLKTLESGEQGGALARLAEDLPLFSAARRPSSSAPPEPPPPSAVEAALAGTRPDELTPKEALDLLYRLKGMLSG
jgi:DNA mismatch repair protein MutS